MVTCAAATPKAKLDCRNYIKRAVCMMLCCVLCSCLLPPPRAKAVTPMSAYVTCGNALASMILSAAGVNMSQSSGSDGIYRVASMLQSAFNGAAEVIGETNQTISEWWASAVATIQAADGIFWGWRMDIPATVMEYARQWALSQYDFSAGDYVEASLATYLDDGTLFNLSYGIDKASGVLSFGTPIPIDGANIVFSSGYYVTTKLSGTRYYAYLYDSAGHLVFSDIFASVYAAGACWYLVYLSGDSSDSGRNISLVKFLPAFDDGKGYVGISSGWYTSLEALGAEESVLTLGKGSRLDIPITKPVTITSKADEYAVVDGVSVPVVDTLTATDVIVTEDEDAEPTTTPAVGEMVGDVALEDVAAAQDSLGAVFISKFPFCIPWDFANAIRLLAAPAQTPRWEVDFYAPIADRVGGWQGDTSIVIDFAEYEILGQLCRWMTTIMFCAALIGATKRLIWT